MRTGLKYKRFIFSALLTIWAVAFAAAQEHFVVTVGETRSYFIQEHEGSEYNWTVFNEPTFTIKSANSEADFPAGHTEHQIDILWKTPGIYYISVLETDISGCINQKAIAVTVMANDRSIGFEFLAGNSCFDGSGNSFTIPLFVLNNNGTPLAEEHFPINLSFSVNQEDHFETIDFSNKQLTIDDEKFDIGPELTTLINVEIIEASDVNDVTLEITTGTLTQTIYALPEIQFSENIKDTIPLNTFHAFGISGSPGYTYNWWYEDENGETHSFSSESNVTEEVFWNTEGEYELFVQATDQNGCLSEIVSKSFAVTPVEGFIPSLVALPDINVGYENTTISGNVSINDFDFRDQDDRFIHSLIGDPVPGLTFFDDGTYDYSPPKDFTGTVNFSYKVCYENHIEECAQTDVEINVLPLNATQNLAPVAATDAALTLPNQTVFSNLAANDIDPDGFGFPLSVNSEPVQEPSNGVVSIDADGSFAYTPNPGFTGIDRFQYRVCDNGSPAMCDSAWVYIFVIDFGDTGQKPISASDDVFLHVADGIYSLRNNDFDLLGENLVYNTSPLIPPAHGTLEIFPDGTFTYFPNDGFIGADWFVYEVCNTDNPPTCRQGTGFMLVSPANQWVELAGKDTTIGNCNPFTLNGLEVDGEFNYSWSPGHMLDDSTKINPVWQPTETTTFRLVVSNEYGFSITDSVKITVTEADADAGQDVYMYLGETAVLDGSNSKGANLHYLWTTENGTIESGANTAKPVIGGFGNYILKVTDNSGCSDVDTVTVGRLTFAPVAQDDYDSTGYRSEIEIYVLDNDYDPENDIDSMSLAITMPPMNGAANVNYIDFTINYRPDNDFSGTDYFEYRICDDFENCDEATVYVMVSENRFFIPNAFSPNGDGINDYFEITGIERYPGNSIEIFNRWGNRVYKAENYGIETSPVFWDGKSNTGIRLGNEDLPTGTYFYVLDLGNGEKRIVGSVYLDR